MTLDLKVEAQKLRTMYNEDPRRDTFNAVIYGGLGTGKTSLLRTCRKPVLVHSFDPGGTTVLQEEIDNGSILADIRFEIEDPTRPTAAKLWDGEYDRLKRLGFFNHLGTYALDSVTTWAQCVMYDILKQQGRSGRVKLNAKIVKDGKTRTTYVGVPQENDWMPQMIVMENAIRDMLSLPCDVILIGHDDVVKDNVTGKMESSLMITGKLKKRVPLLFQEIYYATTKETSAGTIYQLLTQRTGSYQARTRLGKGGELDKYEAPDIKGILRKVGMSTDDKPAL